MNNLIIQQAVSAIHENNCVVFPTETVYGLGANALCKEAVLKIFELKKRPPTNPLIVHVPSLDDCLKVASSLNPLEERLFELFAPGPISLILPKRSEIPKEVSGGLDSVGVRIPNHPIVLEFLKAVGVPICAPSANISGKPSPTSFEMAEHYMKGKAAVLLDGGVLDIGIESTVLKVDKENIYILRAGHITAEMIEEKTGIKPSSNTIISHQSPGTQFTHYKPLAQIILFEDKLDFINENSAILYLNNDLDIDTQEYKYIYHFDNISQYVHALYYTFFLCDQQGIERIYCEIPPNIHQGVALRDRLFRAANS